MDASPDDNFVSNNISYPYSNICYSHDVIPDTDVCRFIKALYNAIFYFPTFGAKSTECQYRPIKKSPVIEEINMSYYYLCQRLKSSATDPYLNWLPSLSDKGKHIVNSCSLPFFEKVIPTELFLSSMKQYCIKNKINIPLSILYSVALVYGKDPISLDIDKTEETLPVYIPNFTNNYSVLNLPVKFLSSNNIIGQFPPLYKLLIILFSSVIDHQLCLSNSVLKGAQLALIMRFLAYSARAIHPFNCLTQNEPCLSITNIIAALYNAVSAFKSESVLKTSSFKYLVNRRLAAPSIKLIDLPQLHASLLFIFKASSFSDILSLNNKKTLSLIKTGYVNADMSHASFAFLLASQYKSTAAYDDANSWGYDFSIAKIYFNNFVIDVDNVTESIVLENVGMNDSSRVDNRIEALEAFLNATPDTSNVKEEEADTPEKEPAESADQVDADTDTSNEFGPDEDKVDSGLEGEDSENSDSMNLDENEGDNIADPNAASGTDLNKPDDFISRDKSGEGFNDYIFRESVLRLYLLLKKSKDSGKLLIEPSRFSALEVWCSQWLFLASRSELEIVMNNLGLMSYLSQTNKTTKK